MRVGGRIACAMSVRRRALARVTASGRSHRALGVNREQATPSTNADEMGIIELGSRAAKFIESLG